MKIPARVTITSLIMMSIILFLGVTGYFGVAFMYKKISSLEEISNELDSVSRLNLTLHEAVSYLNNYLVTGDPDKMARYKKASTEVKQLFENVVAQESKAGRADVSIENARRLYANIDRMSEDLFKYEVPLDSKDAVMLMLEIQQTVDWISRLYLQVHELKDREKLETTMKEAESARKWAGRMQIAGTVSALIIWLILILYNKRIAKAT